MNNRQSFFIFLIALCIIEKDNFIVTFFIIAQMNMICDKKETDINFYFQGAEEK